MDRTSLLVIGAGPYGVAVAARAMEKGIDTTVVGRPMGFWTDNMPVEMFLRSGPDWHLDAAGVHTFEAFIEEEGISPADIDPVPIAVFLAYAAWFQRNKGVKAQDRVVAGLTRGEDGGFVAAFADGSMLAADRVVAAPGNRYYRQVPEWASSVPAEVGGHTVDVVRLDDMSDARVLIVGGRQSAYEWAAIAGDKGAARVDVVHRHNVPTFARVSWKFVDEHVESTLAIPGWWRSLSAAEQDRIARQFWEVGRLTLEWWLTPRISDSRFHRWPGTHVVEAGQLSNGAVEAVLSNGERLEADRVVFATGYKTDVGRVPYLEGLSADIETADGFPVLDESFQSTVPGLYFPGFSSTRDFGPFFGFTKACPAAASIIVDDLLR